MNNAQYVEIAREVLPSEIEVGELRVEYKKAAVALSKSLWAKQVKTRATRLLKMLETGIDYDVKK